MSSSEEEDVVRRPARNGAGQALSDAGSAPRSPVAPSNAGSMNGDDDADLFGSGGSEGGFDLDNEYALPWVHFRYTEDALTHLQAAQTNS